MKRTKSITSFLLAALLGLATIIGVTSTASAKRVHAESENPVNVVVVGISLPSLQDSYVLNISNNLQASFRNRGFTPLVADAQNSSTNQVANIGSFIAQGVRAIVVMPVDGEEAALVGALTEANDAGIIVIVIGENKGLYPNATYVNFSNADRYAERARQDAANFLANRYKSDEDNTVLIFACNNSHGDSYYTELNSIFSNYSNIITIIVRVDNQNETYAYMKNYLDNQGLSDAVFNCCEVNAQAVKQAFIDAGYTFAPGGIPIYGFDSSYSYDYESLADLIADLIQGIMSGEIVPTGNDTYYVDF